MYVRPMSVYDFMKDVNNLMTIMLSSTRDEDKNLLNYANHALDICRWRADELDLLADARPELKNELHEEVVKLFTDTYISIWNVFQTRTPVCQLERTTPLRIEEVCNGTQKQ